MRQKRVSVIIASWNAADVLGRCLETLRTQTVSGDFETIVVDNASTDHTAAVLARHRDHVRVIVNEHNAGFSAANNQAADVAVGDVLFFLNSDTELRSPGVLEHFSKVLDDESVGVAGPKLVYPDGTPQPSCGAHPGVVRALIVATGLHRLAPDRLLLRLAPERWPHDRPADADWLMGAAIALRNDLFRDLGGFWPMMYAEDEDLAYRAQRHGLRVRFDPRAVVMHVGNHSLAQRWSDAERAARIADAELAFLRTHYGAARRGAIRAITGAGYAGRAGVHRLLGRRDRAALFAAMARRYGARPSAARPARLP